MGEVSTIVGGGTPNTNFPEFFGGEIPWVTPADLSGYTQKTISKGARNITEDGLDNSGAHLMPAGSVLFSSRAPIGYVAIAANPISTNQGFKSFVLYDGLSSDFVYYYLQRAKQMAVDLASGTTFPEISGKKAAQIPIPIAPLAEQKRIVEEIEKQFSQLDVGVAALKAAQVHLKRYRAAVLKAACDGQLVPTEAEIARESGALYESADALLARILIERRLQWNGRGEYKEPDTLDATNPLQLPEGWRIVRLSVLAELENGDRGINYPSRSAFVEKGIPFINAGHIENGRVNFEGMNFIAEDIYNSLRAGKTQEADILFCLRGSLGKAAIVKNFSRGCIASSLVIIRASSGILPDYLLNYLLSWWGKKLIEKYDNGTAQPNLSATDLSRFTIALPPLAEQTRIVAEVERRLSVIEALESLIAIDLRRGNRFRQSILHNAFSGQLVPQVSTDSSTEALLQSIKNLVDEASKVKVSPHKEKKKMPSKPVKSLDEIFNRLNDLGGVVPVERLFAASGLGTEEDGADKFFEMLRKGRDDGTLDVPVGKSGMIQRSHNEN